MKFDIKCATFVRLASICNFFELRTPQEIREKLSTVRLEACNGKLLAIATNQQVAAIELLGNIPQGQFGVAHLVLDPRLIAQCKAESVIDSVLTINTIPEIAAASAQTSSGWQFHGNPCYWFDTPDLDDWRKWPADKMPKKSQHIMTWELYHIQALVESSPSGKIVFPEFINAEEPVVIRDLRDPNWVGLFIPKPQGETQKVAAELPAWWRS